MTRIAFALALVLLAAAPAGAAKYKKTHLTVPADRLVSLSALIDASGSAQPTPDASGTPILLQKFAFIATDVIVTPVAAMDTTTPIWVDVNLGGRGFELRRLGAQTHHISLGGAMAATPNQGINVVNHSSVQVQVTVLGYIVDGESQPTGGDPTAGN
jgi:hypothetical protein